jgi:preprotein translocase subunit SecD
MNPNLKWKAVFIASIVLLCIYGLIGLPSFPTSWQGIQDNLGARVKLGLDLRGGTHMILQVQVQEAVSRQNDIVRDRLAQLLRDRSVPFDGVERVDDTHMLVRNVGNSSAFRDLVRDNFSLDWDLTVAPGPGENFSLALKPSAEAAVRSNTLDQAVETIRRRVDALGLVEPVVVPHGRGDNEILVQLPGEDDPSRVKAIIQAGGQLELKLVRAPRQFTSESDCLTNAGTSLGVLPPNTHCVPGRNETKTGATVAGDVWYLLDRSAAVTGADLRTAQPRPSTQIPGRYDVIFTLSAAAAPRFGQFTEANIGQNMAIVLDGKVYTAPNIKGRIEDEGMIEGQFGQEEAKNLALVLRAGALPASIRYLEQRTIGPSLGADSIRQGVYSSMASLFGVMIFMVWYYRMAGLNAVLALVLNLIILMAALAYTGASLTLPGIAGVILTIGMGVDSNVLIFERIREELRAGKANMSAVDAGFDRAWLTIIDTHVTTVVSAAFLFAFGTGPVQGFAVTLVIGLISNLFTAVYVSRTIFTWHLARQSRGAELSI